MALRLNLKLRTVLLGLAALVAIVYGLVMIADLPWQFVASLLLASVIIVTLLALAGLVMAFLARLIVQWRKR
jgi:hypothetical protein